MSLPRSHYRERRMWELLSNLCVALIGAAIIGALINGEGTATMTVTIIVSSMALLIAGIYRHAALVEREDNHVE